MDRDNPIDVDAEPQPPTTKQQQQQQHPHLNGQAAQSSSTSSSSSSSSARPIFALRIPKSVMEWRKAGLHFDYDLITPEAVARDTAGLRTQIRDLQEKVRTNQAMEKQVVVHRELLNAELAMAKAENERLNEALVKQRAEAQRQMGLVEKLKEQLEKRTAELRDEQARFVSAVGSVNRMRSERNALRAEVARLKAPPSTTPTRVKLEEDMDMQIIQDSVVPPAPTVSPVSTNRVTSPAQSTVVAEAPLVEDSPVVEQSPTQQATRPSIPLPPNLKRKRSPEPAPQPPQSEPAPKRKRTPEPAPVQANGNAAQRPQYIQLPSAQQQSANYSSFWWPAAAASPGTATPVVTGVAQPQSRTALPSPLPTPQPRPQVQRPAARMGQPSSQPAAVALPAQPPPQPPQPTPRALGIKHLPLLYRTMNDKMHCRSEGCSKTFPVTASWADLVGHAKEKHKEVCEELEALGPAQVVERANRLQAGVRMPLGKAWKSR